MEYLDSACSQVLIATRLSLDSILSRTMKTTTTASAATRKATTAIMAFRFTATDRAGFFFGSSATAFNGSCSGSIWASCSRSSIPSEESVSGMFDSLRTWVDAASCEGFVEANRGNVSSAWMSAPEAGFSFASTRYSAESAWDIMLGASSKAPSATTGEAGTSEDTFRMPDSSSDPFDEAASSGSDGKLGKDNGGISQEVSTISLIECIGDPVTDAEDSFSSAISFLPYR